MAAIKYRHYIPFPFKTIWIDELSKTLDLLRGKVSFRGLTCRFYFIWPAMIYQHRQLFKV